MVFRLLRDRLCEGLRRSTGAMGERGSGRAGGWRHEIDVRRRWRWGAARVSRGKLRGGLVRRGMIRRTILRAIRRRGARWCSRALFRP